MKRKVLLISMMLAIVSNMAAQDPIALEGKEWNIRTNHHIYYFDIRMWIEGDTIIDNIACKKLYKHTKQLWDGGEELLEVYYCRQEGGKYYQNGELMFDFDMQIGDDFYLNEFFQESDIAYTVTHVGDTTLLDGIKRKYLKMAVKEHGTIKYNSNDIWVEGIGSLSMGGILSNLFNGEGQFIDLQRCLYDGTVIYRTPKPYLIADGLQWANCYHAVQDIYTVAYELNGDTIIDGKTYKKEWRTYWEDLSHMEPTGAVMREQEGKVYRKEDDNDEYLWFDYETSIGDTIFYEHSFVTVVGHSYKTLPIEYSARVYRGIDVQVGTYDASIGDGDSSTYYESYLIPGYTATFYEELGLFDTADIIGTPSFLLTGGHTELLWLILNDRKVYQMAEDVFWKDNTRITSTQLC